MSVRYWLTIVRHLRSVRHLSPIHEFWRPYFLCGLIAQLASNWFNDYFSERYMWISFAFGVALERVVSMERARVRRERLEVVRNLGASRLADAES